MFLTLLETDNKQILRRRAPQNDIATSPRATGGKPITPIFEGGHEEEIKLKGEIFSNLRALRVLRGEHLLNARSVMPRSVQDLRTRAT
jgi:hypothetical protein